MASLQQVKAALYVLYSALAEGYPLDLDPDAQALLSAALRVSVLRADATCTEPLKQALMSISASIGQWYWDPSYDIGKQAALFQELLDSCENE